MDQPVLSSRQHASKRPSMSKPSTPSGSLRTGRSRVLKLGKDLRHMDSRLGVHAALSSETGDTRFQPPPRFGQPPAACYSSHRARPAAGTSNDVTDCVLADVLHQRPMSREETRRIQSNRGKLRQHVDPRRGGRETVVASFQQLFSQEEISDDVSIARRVLLTSARTERANGPEDGMISLRSLPWHEQKKAMLPNESGTSDAGTPRDTLRATNFDGPTTITPRVAHPDSVASSAKAITESPAASISERRSVDATVPAGLPCHIEGIGRPSSGAYGLQSRPLGLRGRPPPSASSAVHLDKSCGSAPAFQGRRRSTSQASSCSRHSSQAEKAADALSDVGSVSSSQRGGRAARARSTSTDSRCSTASAPGPRRISWDKIVESARTGPLILGRAQSAGALNLHARSVERDPFAASRRMKSPGTSNIAREATKDLLAPNRCEEETPIRRFRGGAPPPQKAPGIFEADSQPRTPGDSPYRRMRGAASATAPPERLPLPLGSQGPSSGATDWNANKLYPAHMGIISAMTSVHQGHVIPCRRPSFV